VTARLLPAADPATLDAAVEALRAGQVIAIPTETVYGVAALPNQAAVERLIGTKRRSSEKGIQLLIDSLDQARTIARLSPVAERLARTFWPGGLTLILARDQTTDLPDLLGGGRPTLGLRLPDHEVPRALARRLGPIAASSANLAGLPPALTAAAARAALADDLALIIDDGPVRGGVASTVVDCASDPRAARVLREGAIPASEIARVSAAEPARVGRTRLREK
jgi:L-threonylcarbamoyladenylate synthase